MHLHFNMLTLEVTRKCMFLGHVFLTSSFCHYNVSLSLTFKFSAETMCVCTYT